MALSTLLDTRLLFQLQRLSELEEIVEEQDTALGTASEKYRQGKESLKILKEKLENNIKLMNNKMKELVIHIEINFISSQYLFS